MIFSKKEKTPLLPLSEVFRKLNVENEKEFVKKFFTLGVVSEILEDCGIEIPNEEKDIQYDISIKMGKGTLFPDILFSVGDGDLFVYFEVMSQKDGGRWDDEHHRQLILKRAALEVEYGPDVMCFAVAFKEFDDEYRSFFTGLDNCYGIQVYFDEKNEYDINVLGLDEKKEKNRMKISEANKVCEKWSNKLNENGLKCSPEKNWLSYANVGKPYNGTKKGIQFLFKRENKVGIKLHGILYSKDEFNWMIQDSNLVVEKLKKLTNCSFTVSSALKDKTFIFDFQKDDFSIENLNLLKLIYNSFREVTALDKLES